MNNIYYEKQFARILYYFEKVMIVTLQNQRHN